MGHRVRVAGLGFPSPDSDYDCRFFYLRHEHAYVSLWPPRDVLETPLDKVFDVNGWDLAKALRLPLRGNATVNEWLTSPIVYRGDGEFHRAFCDVTEQVFRVDPLRRHYLHLAQRQLTNAAVGDEIALNRIFYALRPAFSLPWLRKQGSMPPMDLPALMAGCEPDPDLRAPIDELLERKARTRELGTGALPAVMESFVRREMALASDSIPTDAGPPPTEARETCDAFFRWALQRFAPASCEQLASYAGTAGLPTWRAWPLLSSLAPMIDSAHARVRHRSKSRGGHYSALSHLGPAR